MPHRSITSRPFRHRRGTVLVIVLVVVMMLALAGYRFTESMVTERNAASLLTRGLQSRLAAESGVEMFAALLDLRTSNLSEPLNLFSNPSLFQSVPVNQASSSYAQCRFSLVTDDGQNTLGQAVRFGVVNESSRLDLNSLVSLSDEEARDRLLALPGMTIETADAILDWNDENQTPRQYGAEHEYDGMLSPPYSAANQRPASVDELLSVRGVTPLLLYGEDANVNGLLDPSENDGEMSLPWDNGDGFLDRGWAAYLTAYSAELLLQIDGSPRIDVNGDDLQTLFDELSAAFDADVATFVTALRMFGPSSQGGSGSGSGSSRQSGGGASGGRSGGGVSGPGSGGQSSGALGSAGQRGGSQSSNGRNQNVFDLSRAPSYDITSLYELIDSSVQVVMNNRQQTLQSPWTSESSDLSGALPDMLDKLKTTSSTSQPGRIDIRTASREVLLTVPDIDPQLVELIVGRQTELTLAGVGTDTVDLLATTGWLLQEGHVDRAEMQRLDPYLTARGDVFRVQSFCCLDTSGPCVRLEAVVDGSQVPARIISVRDLTAVGRGYLPELMFGHQ